MQCSDIREMLSAYIDEVLDERETAEVEQHVRACSACLQELRELQETVTLLRSLGEVSPPEDFRVRLRKRLEQEPVPGGVTDVPARRGGFLKWVRSSRKYLAAAAVILGIVISAAVYSINQMKADSTATELALNRPASSEPVKSKGINTENTGSTPNQQDAEQGRGPEDVKPAYGTGGGSEGGAGSKQHSGRDVSGRELEKPVGQDRSNSSAGQDNPVSTARVPQTAGPAGENLGAPAGPPADDVRSGGETTGVPPAGKELKMVETGDSAPRTTGAFNALGAPDSASDGAGDAEKGISQQGGGTAAAVNEQNAARQPEGDMGSGEPGTGKPGAASEKSELRVAGNTAEPVQPDGSEPAGKKLPGAGDTGSGQAVVRDGFLTIEVADYAKFSNKLTFLIDRYHGFVENSAEKTGVPVSASFIIIVPSGEFTNLMDSIAALGTITEKQVTRRDASGQVTGDNAVNSTIRLEVRQAAASREQPDRGAFSKAAGNFKDSAAEMAEFVGGMVAFLGLILPWLLALGVLGGAFYYLRKRKRNGDR